MEIILFGKPRSFQAFSLSKNKLIPVEDFNVGEFIPESYSDLIFQRSKRKGRYVLQLYTRALEANGPARVGITIGVAFATEKRLAVDYNNFDFLHSFLKEFKAHSLDNDRFKYDDIEKCINIFINKKFLDIESKMHFDEAQESNDTKITVVKSFDELKGLKKNSSNHLIFLSNEKIVDYKSNIKAISEYGRNLNIIKKGKIIPINKGTKNPNPPDELENLKSKIISLQNEIKNNDTYTHRLKERLTISKQINWMIVPFAILSFVSAVYFGYQNLNTVETTGLTPKNHIDSSAKKSPSPVKSDSIYSEKKVEMQCVKLKRGEAFGNAVKRLSKENDTLYTWEAVLKGMNLNKGDERNLLPDTKICPPSE